MPGGINQSRNPFAANDVTDWGGPTGWVRQTGQSVGDTGRTTCGRRTVPTGAYPNLGNSGTIAATDATASGRPISFVYWARSSVTRPYTYFLSKYDGPGDTYVGQATTPASTTLTANTWTKLRGTGTVFAGGTYDRIGVHSDLTTSAAGTLDVSGIRIVLGVTDATLEPMDGDTPGWTWDGAAGNSSSQEVTVAAGPEPGRFLLAA